MQNANAPAADRGAAGSSSGWRDPQHSPTERSALEAAGIGVAPADKLVCNAPANVDTKVTTSCAERVRRVLHEID